MTQQYGHNPHDRPGVTGALEGKVRAVEEKLGAS